MIEWLDTATQSKTIEYGEIEIVAHGINKPWRWSFNAGCRYSYHFSLGNSRTVRSNEFIRSTEANEWSERNFKSMIQYNLLSPKMETDGDGGVNDGVLSVPE